jgi:hypothetical protein
MIPVLRPWGIRLKRKISIAKRALLRLGGKGMVKISTNAQGKTIVNLG